MPLFYRLRSLVRAGALEAAGITAIPETTMTQDAPHHLRLLFIYTGLDTWILQLFFFPPEYFFPPCMEDPLHLHPGSHHQDRARDTGAGAPPTLSLWGILSTFSLPQQPHKAAVSLTQSSHTPGLCNHLAWIRFDLKTMRCAELEQANAARKPARNTISTPPTTTNTNIGLNVCMNCLSNCEGCRKKLQPAYG